AILRRRAKTGGPNSSRRGPAHDRKQNVAGRVSENGGHAWRNDRGRTRRDGKARNKRELDRCDRGRDQTRTRNGERKFITPCALPRSALPAETKSQTRARPDGAASIIHLPRARRLRLRPKQTLCARPNKSCRKPSRAVRVVALLSARDRRDSNQPAWHS